MIRMEYIDDAMGVRRSFLRNYYYYSGAWYHQSTVFGDGEDSGDPALCVNKNLGNLEVVIRRGNQMRHYWRDETTGIWNSGKVFGDNVRSDPALICNSQNNNLEVVVREGAFAALLGVTMPPEIGLSILMYLPMTYPEVLQWYKVPMEICR